ncbi:XrtA system polysaccharide deacetylase [Marinobacter salsuginis]|uniref:Polysaccharide deacetylase n=1 Tax=Marinobacter salsuginis TaxID=418719 RepID=A0A5M3Q4K7_9GAMM|nr:XrtA system polysaccharide deacetylase [Marinobacter salsuginis]GBO90132.1 polysaccharide deacetylase [Marinobacter salsuginis]
MTSPDAKEAPLHAMSIDVEDYFHVAALSNVIRPEQWDSLPSRVEQNTELLLELFERHSVKATFFVLGWVAERFPQLVQKLASHGHEIASHGYSHQLIYNQSVETFREETLRSKDLLESIIGKEVCGYRAASYSITRESLWALDILSEAGFTWDSSIFPVRHDRYGIPDSPSAPYSIETESGSIIREFPLTTAHVMGLAIPAAGGGYFRQFPYAVFRYLFLNASGFGDRPQMFYLHPWEVDPDQPRYNNASWFSRFRHYTNLDKCYGRLEQLLQDFRFSTVSESYNAYEHDKTLVRSNQMIRLA